MVPRSKVLFIRRYINDSGLKKLRRLSFNDLLALPNGIENYQQAKVIMSDIIVALSGGVDSACCGDVTFECGTLFAGSLCGIVTRRR